VAIDYKDMQVTNCNRKLKFFLDKLNAEEQQKDSFAKMVKDLVLSRVSMMIKAAAPIIGLVLLLLVLLVAVVAIPVVAIIAVIYNSPFAIFFPSISSGDTTQNVLSAYVSEFNGDINDELANHSGYDISEKIYVDFEGAGTPDNYYDILAVYMV
jgi:phospholipase/lecithinase/hemolysin